MARFVDSSGSPLGCDSDSMACGPPLLGRPAAFKFDSDESERGGGEEAAARATTSQARTCPTNRPISYPPPLNAADVKAFPARAGFKFVPGRGEGTRRYAIRRRSEPADGDPKRRACQHLPDLSW